jgi:hypothetical protein
MPDGLQGGSHVEYLLGPRTLTVLCTYRCTAACKSCCFESSPQVRGRLPLQTIIARIQEAYDSFPTLRVVVFSGGEALLLKEDLYQAVAFSSGLGLSTRIVSNGFWGATVDRAQATARRLKEAGLRELNISSGSDHMEWVSAEAVANAACAASDAGIFTLLTVEAEATDTHCFEDIMSRPGMSERISRKGGIQIQHNSWMPFNDKATERIQDAGVGCHEGGCAQVFNVVVVTPHDNLSACCGLTLEHIPEMRLGRNSGGNMKQLYDSQLDDFLKYWIHVDGPSQVVRQVLPESANELLQGVVHICQACVILHKNEKIRSALKERWQEFAPSVMTRFHAGQFVLNSSDRLAEMAVATPQEHHPEERVTQ